MASLKVLLTGAITDIEAAWLAAAIDGEGWIFVAKPGEGKRKWPQVYVGVVNTNKEFVAKAANLMRTNVSLSAVFDYRHYGRKAVYRAVASGHKKALRVLEAILPYLIIKRGKAEDAILFIKSREWGRTKESYQIGNQKAWETRLARSHVIRNERGFSK